MIRPFFRKTLPITITGLIFFITTLMTDGSSGGSFVKHDAESLKDNQTFWKEYARLSEIVSNLPKRGLAFPGNKPVRNLTEIASQASSLLYHKQILDKFEEAAVQSHDSEMLVATNFYWFILSSNLRLYYEALSLANEISLRNLTEIQSADQINFIKNGCSETKRLIELKVGAPADEVHSKAMHRMDLHVPLKKIWDSAFDLTKIQKIWPKILTVFQQIVRYLEDKGGASNILQFAALLNAEPEVDNVLNFLSQHGFPQLNPFGDAVALKMKIFISTLTHISNDREKVDRGRPVEVKKLVSKINQLDLKIWTLFKPVEVQKTVLKLENEDLAFQILLQFLRRPEISEGYHRIVENFERDPILEPFFDNSVNYSTIDKNSGSPIEYKVPLIQILENFLQWHPLSPPSSDNTAGQKQRQRWTYVDKKNGLQLTQVDNKDQTKNLRVTRSLLLKLYDDLESYMESPNFEAEEKSVTQKLMGQLSFIRAVDTLDKIVTDIVKRSMSMLTTTTTTTKEENFSVDQIVKMVQDILDSISHLTDLMEFGTTVQRGKELNLLGIQEIQNEIEATGNNEADKIRLMEAKKMLSDMIESLQKIHQEDSISGRILNKILYHLTKEGKSNEDDGKVKEEKSGPYSSSSHTKFEKGAKIEL